MLAAIGVGSVEELFDRQIPETVRLRKPLALAEGKGEQEVYAHLRELARRNTSTEDELSFLGAGMYDHYVPAIVDMITERSEFLTPYTPYQPEISQGGLQAMFEYQTAISELTALPVSNASVYEGPSAVASAAYLAKLANGKPKLVVSRGLHPHSRDTLQTYAHGFGAEAVEVPLRDAATEAYLRRMPGRIAGQTTDADGRRGFVLTLQTREQHIRREKATSNICTSQALNALAGVVYLSWLGKQGLVELGELLLQRTHYAREALCALDGVEALHSQPVVREFALKLSAPVEKVVARCQEQGINPGLALEDDVLLVAITEQRSRADIDRLADVLGSAVAAERQAVHA